MNKKGIERRFEYIDNNFEAIVKWHNDLSQRVKSLERTRDTFLENKTPNELRANVGMNKLDTNLYIDMYELSKNRCPRCGSHHLFYEFHGNSLEDSKIYCKDCGNHWQFGKSDVAPINPYDEVKELSEMLDKKQFAYDDCFEELERARDRIKNQNSKIAILEKENVNLKDDLDDWKKGPYDYLKGICDKQQAKIKALEPALEVLFNKFDLESESFGTGFGQYTINNLKINSTGFINDKNSGYKALVNLDDKEYTTLVEAWDIIRKNK